ncbi:hypothetical protein BDZ89DRAFT_651914 [Hymenopellis radicata]|nr:hypothetical protein BDZ89DRAFT_651914 [Hymenopellis radicata]
MNFFATIFVTLFLLINVAMSAPVDMRDVFVPPILYPNSSTVWKAGSTQSVTWDASKPPKSITNKQGVIMLVTPDGKLQYQKPLAKGFDILDGKHDIQLPADLATGSVGRLGESKPTIHH